MTGDWTTAVIGDCFELVGGYAFKSGEFIETGIPVIKIKNVKANRMLFDTLSYVAPEFLKTRADKVVQKGDLLITMSGNRFDGSPDTWVGKVAQFNESRPFLLNQRVGILRPKKGTELDRRFFSYSLSSHFYQTEFIAIATSSGGQANLSPPQILGAPIEFPPLAEQRAIASVLGALDDKIELNRRMNATLESMARALFQSWFIDFDPVRAKLDNRHPTGMDAETATLFPDSFEHGVDGEIRPKGWIKTTIGDEITFQTGFSFQSEFFTETPPGIRLARGMNVKEGEFFWSNQSRYWPQVTPDIEQYLLRVGDVLIGMDGSKVGKNWVRVRAADLPCLLVQRVARLREADSFGQNFIALLIGSPAFRDFVEAVKTGTSIPHISGGQIKGYSFLRPPCDDNRIFQRFESLVGPMTAQADKNHAEAEILSNLRDTLLPKLLSGELSVAAAEHHVPEKSWT